MAVEHIKNKAEYDKLIRGDKPVLIDFAASWCGPCQMMAPIFEELSEDYKNADKVVIAKIDVDEIAEVAMANHVMSVPTFLFFQDGKMVETMVGMKTKEALEAKLDQLVAGQLK